MALIECHECGKSISNEAKVCPHCGVKPKKPKSKIVRAGIYFFVGVFILSGIMSGFRDEHEKQRIAALPPEQRAIEENKLAQKQQAEKDWKDSWGAIDRCRADLERSMKDPDSVKYSDEVETTPFVKGKNGTYVATIGLRAKNSFGAMVPSMYLCTVKRDGDNWTVSKLIEIAR